MPLLEFRPLPLRKWFRLQQGGRTAHVAGWAFVQGVLQGAEDLARRVLNNAGMTADNLLREWNGNFACVAEEGERLWCGVDGIRSIPLFCRTRDSGVAISDDIRLIQNETDTVDPDSLMELATAGYVTGPHTLFGAIRSLQSGECLTWGGDDRAPQAQRYYEYTCTYDAEGSAEELCARLDDAVLAAFGRTIATLGGRQAVVPLSGGLDSRLVAATLKRLGYENVLCFSYGRPGNRETARSRAVAEALGYGWVQVPYTAAGLREALRSREVRDYRAFSTNGVSLPHLDDWPAVRLLRDRRQVDPDAVFIPGHTGDFICGSHLKYIFYPDGSRSPDLTAAMLQKHYSLWEDLVADDHIRKMVERHLSEVLARFPAETDEDVAGMYEFWEWQERQSKYIINAVRVYEFFNFEWRLPLWDRDFIDFWRHVPISLKMHKILYCRYLASHDPFRVFQQISQNILHPHHYRRPVKRRLIEDMKRNTSLTSAVLNRYRKARRHWRIYKHDPIGFPRAYGAVRYIFMEPSKRHHVALLLKDFLRDHYGIKLKNIVSLARLPAPGKGCTAI